MEIIDIHIHGIAGFDTRTRDPDEILKIAEIEGVLGVSGVLLTLYPSSIEEMRSNMEAIKKAMTENKKGAKILGVHLEGPFLNPKRAGALDPEFFFKPSKDILKKLVEGFEDLIKIITLSPELEGAIELIKIIRDMGILVNLGHSDATYEETEKAFRKGATGITHIFNAQRPIHHREPGIAGFGLINPHIYIEVIADGLHLHKAMIDLIFKIKPKEKIILISDSIKETKTQKMEEKKLSGGFLTLKEIFERLIREGYEKDLLEKMVCYNPKEYLGLKDI